MGSSLKSARFLIESRLVDAARGDISACIDLGILYSTGSAELAVDLVEAHKWFNLAALKGNIDAQQWRADLAEDMTARQVAEAQRQARAWLQATERRAA